jgi:CheY-like chemotaxis protein
MNLRPILLVEDNHDDAFFMRRAFEAVGVGNQVSIMADGEAAIEFFNGPDTGDEMKRPCMVLLDVKLPLKNGLEVLEVIRSRDDLRTIPVIMLSSSNEPSDVSRALHLGANAYVVKPAAYGDLTKLVASIRDFWLRYHRSAC